MNNEKPVLQVKNLQHRFGKGCTYCLSGLDTNTCPVCGSVYALQGISFDLYPQEILGIVGESGSGKSTLMKSLYFDIRPSSGEFNIERYGEENLFTVSRQKQKAIRNIDLGMVYQNPVDGLRMRFSAMSNVVEKLLAAGQRHVGTMTERASGLLEEVRISKSRFKGMPRDFSGGMQQRVQIAKALSNNPPILFLDEITTGLDLSVQAKVLDIVMQIRREFDISMLLVSHDLSVVRMLADRTLVLLDGKVIEEGLTDQIMEDPKEPYTQELVHSLLV
jgi:putative phosphonate transport system ATP-binding protein